MLTGSIPPTGIPLPFVSAGGTSVSIFMGAMGVLCNVGKSRESGEEFKMNKVDVNLFKSKKKKESDF